MGGAHLNTASCMGLFLSLYYCLVDCTSVNVETHVLEGNPTVLHPRQSSLHQAKDEDIRNTVSTTPTPAFNIIPSPCDKTSDPVYGGDLFDCQNRGITRIDPRWFPVNTTTIYLDHNKIHTVENDTFSHLHLLKKLSMAYSEVQEIEVDALKGLGNLHHLKLEYNNLQYLRQPFPRRLFSHVPLLRYLFLCYNYKNGGSILPITDYMNATAYPHYLNIFFLKDLRYLTIDSFPELQLSEEFANLTNLARLKICGDQLFKVTNESFCGLRTIQLKSLYMKGFNDKNFDRFDTGAFQYLSWLENLTIEGFPPGNLEVVKTLWPFVNRKMILLILQATKLNRHDMSGSIALEGGLIRRDPTMKYLGKICISHMAWKYSKLFAVEPGAFVTPIWKLCLKTLDLSGNNFGFIGWRGVLADFTKFLFLESIAVTSSVVSTEDADVIFNLGARLPLVDWNVATSVNMSTHGISGNSEGLLDEKNSFSNRPDFPILPAHNDKTYDFSRLVTKTNGSDNMQSGRALDIPEMKNDAQYFPSGGCKHIMNVKVYLPKGLKVVKVMDVSHNIVIGDTCIVWEVENAKNLQEIYYVSFPKLFIGGAEKVTGLHWLKVLDLSSSGLQVKEYFFDDLPSIEVLVLRSILPPRYFDTVMSVKRLIRNMTNLRYLDLSNNALGSFLPGTFSTNSHLTHLNLTDNRFRSFPLDLALVPELQVLDLTRNSILYFTSEEMAAIDLHVARAGTFYIYLQGNTLACVCSQMQFLGWLQTTKATLDIGANYTCTTQNGRATNTAALSDMMAFWRQCNGWTSFMVSLVLTLLLIIAFLAKYLHSRFGHAIVAVILRVIAPQFRPKTPQDYKTDVFIGYADDDFRFVRNVLTEFLEGELHLRTFIHQRDFPVGGYKDQLFFDAIQESWRILLVITETFLQQYDMADIVMKYSTHSVSAENQGRVLVLVEEGQVNAIPGYLHEALDDTRIIVISNMAVNRLGYEQRQNIKTCMRPV